MRKFGTVLKVIAVLLILVALYGYIKVGTSGVSAQEADMSLSLSIAFGGYGAVSSFDRVLYSIILYRKIFLIVGAVCMVCGILFGRIGAANEAKSVTSRDTVTWHCPDCNQSNPNTAKTCTNCGKNKPY